MNNKNRGILNIDMNKTQQDYFDVSEEFFLLHSDNLQLSKQKLYGYYISQNGIYENENFNSEEFKNCDGRGCYVYVEKKDNIIKIYQDFNGSYGIYYFKNNDFFAISNSFFVLSEFLKDKYLLTINRDYINHFLLLALESDAYSETPYNEIKILDRSSILKIDIKDKNINIESINYNEATISIDTEQGLETLDKWYNFWTSLIRNLYNKTKQISVDLSGGYDSRLTFLLVLCSGIDLNSIRVNSNSDKLHTHVEDFDIASQIARHYSFNLNRPLKNDNKLNYSYNDVLNIEFYSKLMFHKEPYFKTFKRYNKVYSFGGSSGEAIRSIRWDKPYEELAKLLCMPATAYSKKLYEDILNSMTNILKHGYELVEKKFNLPKNTSESGHRLLWETQCRSHFGKIKVITYFSNTFVFSPLMDPTLLKIKIQSEKCDDRNLLFSTIFTRYCPKLFDFKWEGNRYKISESTIEYAKQINKLYPLNIKINDLNEDFELIPNDNKIKEITNIKNNQPASLSVLNKYLEDVFTSSSTRGLFTSMFDEQIYERAFGYMINNKFFSIRHGYSIIGAAKIIRDSILTASSFSEHKIFDAFNYFLKHNYYEYYSYSNILHRIRNYISARIDIKLINEDNSLSNIDMNLSSISDGMCRVDSPKWFQNDGIGYILTSYNGILEFNISTKSGGKILLTLRSVDKKDDSNAKRIQYWIDYTCLIIDNNIIFNKTKSLWHDNPFTYSFVVKQNSSVSVKLTWLPHAV